ncbi:MAG: hypothetical protein JXB07_20270 [Anaerolineae bacterium]|nr:hypothetical protein [Anaerolineae bacterium]
MKNWLIVLMWIVMGLVACGGPQPNDPFEPQGQVANHRILQTLALPDRNLAVSRYQVVAEGGELQAECLGLAIEPTPADSGAWKTCSQTIPSWTAPFELVGTFIGSEDVFGDYSIVTGLITDPEAQWVRVTWEDGTVQVVDVGEEGSFVAIYIARMAHPPQLEALDGMGNVIADWPRPTE